MAPKQFKVVIVGGSVAGLSLALMLEQNGIDFVVLEAYPEIAPQVGASISIQPNGMRTLAQLGCADAIVEQAQYPVDKVIFRDSNGEELSTMGDLAKTIVDQYGYPIIFLDRKMLIQSMYDKIQNKSKVLTSQRVVTVENLSDSVAVTTAAGKTFTGDIVIGADGIHSRVRSEMWRVAQNKLPLWVDAAEQQEVACTYVCIFGISEGVKGIEKGTMTSVFNEQFSYLVPSGPGDKTYWFLVRNLGKTVYGDDIPRFTKEEEYAFAKQHFNDQITPTLKFVDLYKSKTSSVYTTLPEYVYKQWYSERIVTVGDSCHKFEPLTGHGGNNAIETAASLVNNLVAALKESPDSRLPTERIVKAFKATQNQREDRVLNLVQAAHTRQSVECMETPVKKFIARKVLPNIPRWMMMTRFIGNYAPAPSLNALPHKIKAHAVPYHDELLRQPKSRARGVTLLLLATYLVLALIARHFLFTAGNSNGTFGLIREALVQGVVPGGEAPIRRSYTGLAGIDKLLGFLVTMFLPAVDGAVGPQQTVQLMYFMSTLVPLLAIMILEGFRPRNSLTLVAIPSIWGLLFQLGGIGFIGQLYFFFSLYSAGHVNYYIRQEREISASVSKAVLPAIIIGFVLPSLFLFFPTSSMHLHQGAIALWQPMPVVIGLITRLFSWMIRRSQPRTKYTSTGTGKNLKTMYLITGLIAAAVHLTVVFNCITSKDLSLASIFLPSSDSFTPKDIGHGVFIFFQYDFLLCTLGFLIWGSVTMWDLYRFGLSSISPLVAVGGILAASAVLGPGATIAGVWFWREQATSGAAWKSGDNKLTTMATQKSAKN